MKLKLTAMLAVCVSVAMPVWGQTTSGKSASGSDEIHGSGTAGHLTKFTGSHTVGNSGLTENGGTIATAEDISAGAVSATVSSAPGVAVTAISTVTDGSTDGNAFYSSGIAGVLAETSSPASAAVKALVFAQHGDPVGVWAKIVSQDAGYAIRGEAIADTGSGVGVSGETNMENGYGVLGVNGGPGNPTGIIGYVVSPDGGTGILGRQWSNTGRGRGIKGETFSADGVAGEFQNFAGGDLIYGVGSTGLQFRVANNGTVYANGGFQPSGADFAEEMKVSGDRSKYLAGDLLVIDATAEGKLKLSQEPYSTLVAGIYSTKPGMLGSTRKADEAASADAVPLAVVGIVPCKVSTENGAIHAGDLLVTSSLAGHAMKGTDRSKMMGAVVGKALGSLETGTGVIPVLVTLQ